jgi:hypothetical protein
MLLINEENFTGRSKVVSQFVKCKTVNYCNHKLRVFKGSIVRQSWWDGRKAGKRRIVELLLQIRGRYVYDVFTIVNWHNFRKKLLFVY